MKSYTKKSKKKKKMSFLDNILPDSFWKVVQRGKQQGFGSFCICM